MLILYIETNMIMAVAKGRDLEAEQLLRNPPPSINIAIPSICYIEAINTYRKDKEYQLKFQAEMDKQINESIRDQKSIHAKSFSRHLQKASIENTLLLNDIQNRFSEIINLLLDNAETINFQNNIIQEIGSQVFLEKETLLIKNDLMENLILQSILDHANQHPNKQKVFISGNTKDFRKQNVQQILNSAGIEYFSNTKDFLGWLESQSS
ncbi:PIN domain-containing protein [Anabaena sp. UHCC 0451]|uniref:PIN domain-containing protein n=1 Tax=Anabaena sp. UHCC 0451 TaxID=2055235 RepID=UPI002B209FDD|nr:PIN domain-containing protein [Anabaena sp. UHCC 0451]MEA5576506.1 PIN domain-containing protein [Anabaena sp. UHCC 0451]